MNKLKKVIAGGMVLGLLLVSPTSVFAQRWSDPTGDQPAKFSDLEVVFENVLGLIVGFAGLAIFVMFVIGGYRFLTSAGDPQKNAQARGTMTWAIVGLVALFGAWFILRLLTEFTGINLTIFRIPQ
jgi:hypothetical protein